MFDLDATPTPTSFHVELEQATFYDKILRHPVVVQSFALQCTKGERRLLQKAELAKTFQNLDP